MNFGALSVPTFTFSIAVFVIFQPEPGRQFLVQAIPVVSGGANLAMGGFTKDIKVTAAKGCRLSGPKRPFDLMTGYTHAATYSKDSGSEEKMVRAVCPKLDGSTPRAVDVEVRFAHTAVVQSGFVRGNISMLSGMVPDRHDLSRPDSVEFLFYGPDGRRKSVKPWIAHGFSSWEAVWCTQKPVRADRLVIRMVCRAALSLDGLCLMGHRMSDINPGCTVAPAADILCQWTDEAGRPLSKPVLLSVDRRNSVLSPARPKEGYMELKFSTLSPGIHLSRDRFGFVIRKTRKTAKPDLSSPFGIIHADITDPNLSGFWVKALSLEAGWDFDKGSLDTRTWKDLIDKRTAKGLCELPLFTDDVWQTDSTKPVSAAKLRQIGDKLRRYVEATPEIRFWELGIEENLRWRAHKKEWTHYWSNLEAKFRTARKVLDGIDPDMKLLYQVAELDYDSLEDFAMSKVPRYVDVLSLHPYAWPDFPSPDTWLPGFLNRARRIMKKQRFAQQMSTCFQMETGNAWLYGRKSLLSSSGEFLTVPAL